MANKQMHHLKVGDNIFEIVDSVARSGISGAPTIVSLSSAMSDTSKLYLYIGSETGYTSGDWYYHNGTSWVSGGQYGDMQLDTSLTTSGMAADAKSVGDRFNNFATTATAGQAPIADGAGGWAWGNVQGGGTPTPVSRASDMTDTSKVYLYTGSESGYSAGHIYYHNGSAWVDGGEYGGALPSVTTSDNGKFLRVVSGAWAVASVPSAESEVY